MKKEFRAMKKYDEKEKIIKEITESLKTVNLELLELVRSFIYGICK